MDTWCDVNHTSNLNEVRTKKRKGAIFWQESAERGREKRERGERGSISLYDLRRSVNRFPTGQGLKSEYSTRSTCGYRKLQVSPRFAQKVREVKSFGFRKCPQDFLEALLTLQEVGNLPTRVYFPSRSRFGLG